MLCRLCIVYACMNGVVCCVISDYLHDQSRIFQAPHGIASIWQRAASEV
jgi:hypothetical protein